MQRKYSVVFIQFHTALGHLAFKGSLVTTKIVYQLSEQTGEERASDDTKSLNVPRNLHCKHKRKSHIYSTKSIQLNILMVRQSGLPPLVGWEDMDGAGNIFCTFPQVAGRQSIGGDPYYEKAETVGQHSSLVEFFITPHPLRALQRGGKVSSLRTAVWTLQCVGATTRHRWRNRNGGPTQQLVSGEKLIDAANCQESSNI